MDLHPKQFARLCVRAVQEEGVVERKLDRRFSVDPRTITLDLLQRLLATALHIRNDFDLIFHRSSGESVPLTCDWDLEGALAEEPRLQLSLRLKPKEPGFEEWDIICAADLPINRQEPPSIRTRRHSFLEQIFRPRTPSFYLSGSDFQVLSDCPSPLRYSVYRAEGADPDIRPSLWMHLLDVFPADTTRHQREEFLNKKSEEYYGLRHSWQKLVRAGTIPPILRDITCLIRKDVRRTDRLQDLDEHALYNILTTYAVHHPSTGYCQGMSDLLSPLLHVMKTEARAYVAFCGLMLRMRDNFCRDGRSMHTKFRHLRRALRLHDPFLYDYLSNVGALDFLFCYRWLLLDLKREFPYDEMLRFLEVLWSTLRPLHLEKGVDLYEVRFPTPSISQSIRTKIDPKDLLVFTENYFGSPKRRTFLKRHSTPNICSNPSTDDEEEVWIIPYRRRKRRKSRNVCSSVPDVYDTRKYMCYSNTLPDLRINTWLSDSPNSSERRRHGSTDSNYESNISDEDLEEEKAPSRDKSEGYISDSQHTMTTDHSQSSESEHEHHLLEDSSLDSIDSADTYFSDSRHPATPLLPPPTRLGDGKPFLVFVCLTLLLSQRDVILTNKMDANEIGIHFDRLVRGHRLDDILPTAKQKFVEYLHLGWTDDDH